VAVQAACHAAGMERASSPREAVDHAHELSRSDGTRPPQVSL
jgi:hypothetical protein